MQLNRVYVVKQKRTGVTYNVRSTVSSKESVIVRELNTIKIQELSNVIATRKCGREVDVI